MITTCEVKENCFRFIKIKTDKSKIDDYSWQFLNSDSCKNFYPISTAYQKCTN